MINLFYRDEHLGQRMTGPKKVILNIIKSFEDCNIPFSVNKEIYKNNLFLHWDNYHIGLYQTIKNKQKLLVGPQIWPFSSEFNNLNEYGKIISPSQWVANLFIKHFNVENNLIWPVAIYQPEIYDNQSIDCLIYFKNREKQDLEYIKSVLSKRKITSIQLNYGSYTQNDFKECLSSVKFCIIIDNTESQGIAIQEMMAANKPLFVWDMPIWNHMGNDYIIPASSVPYWSSECGEKIVNSEDIEEKLEIFISNLENYSPKDYVNRELSPQKSVQILTDYYAS